MKGSIAQKLRKTEKLKSYSTWYHGHGRTKTISKEPVFLGRLFSSPLCQYIFHQVSTKRGRSIFYHKGLWTQSHVYAGQHTRTHTKQLNCLNTGLECNKSRLSISALRWKRSYRESKKTLNCLSKERKAYREEKNLRMFLSKRWQYKGQVFQTSPHILLWNHLLHHVLVTCESQHLGMWTSFKATVNEWISEFSMCEKLTFWWQVFLMHTASFCTAIPPNETQCFWKVGGLNSECSSC